MNTLVKFFLIAVFSGIGFTAFGQPYGNRYMPQHGDRHLPFRSNRGIPMYERRGSVPYPYSNRTRESQYINKIQAAKETYMNMQLQLTEPEAERFWPLYRQYDQELSNVRRLKRINNSSEQPNGSDQINKELYYEQRLVEIRRHYTDEFLRILPPQKVSLIFKSERQFNDELVRQMGERRGQVPQSNRAMPERRY